jgi:hypothetical protein
MLNRGDEFGRALAVQGNVAVVGAPNDEVGSHTHGAAYVFSRRSHGWLQDRKLLARDSDVFDGFGLRVAVSGDTIAVGSMFDHDASLYSGAAYVYQRSGQSGWSLREKLFPSDAARDDAFGSAVAVSDNAVLVGAFGKSDVAFYAGAAYVFEF